jgi:hypothetical protein
MIVFIGFITPVEMWIVVIHAWDFQEYYLRAYRIVDIVLIVRSVAKLLVDGLMFAMFL